MKTILLPTDFSKNSINAINYAVALCKHIECKFYILNVQKASTFISDDMMVPNATATIYNTIVDVAKKSINNIIIKIENKYNNKKHHFSAVVDYDNFIDSINQVSEKYNVDLIIMGTKGASGVSKILFGSNTVKVIQRSKVPVLAIPEHCEFSSLDKIGFITSFKTLYNFKNLKLLKYFTDLNYSELFILHALVNDDFASELDKNYDLFKQNFEKTIFKNLQVNDNNVYEAIHTFAKTNAVKMIAMCITKHSFFERLFIMHTFETIAFNIDVPFLVMKKSKK